MKSRSDIKESYGECTLASCWLAHSATTNLLGMHNCSFGQELIESSLERNAAVTQTWRGEAGLANPHSGSVRFEEPDHSAN